MKPLILQDRCPDCGVGFGEIHQPNCDLDVCPFCGVQMLQDDCRYTFFGIDVERMEETHPDIYAYGLPDAMDSAYEAFVHPHLLKWDGVWPGVRECRTYGLWCKMTAQDGWQICDADDPDATEDLNTLLLRGRWDSEAKRYVIADYEMEQIP